jgi:hypothetical protein
MGLTEVPSELFRKENVKHLFLSFNNLCSLPSEIAHLTMLETLYVRLSKRLVRDLTLRRVLSGLQRPAHVPSARARSADQSQGASRAAPRGQKDRYLTPPVALSGLQQPAYVAARRNRPACAAGVARSTKIELTTEWIVI